MANLQNPDDDPDGENAFATVAPPQPPPALGPFATDPSDPTLDGGQVLYHMAFGAKPEDFHPALQPLAQGYSALFQPQPPKVPGLLGSPEDIRRAIGAGVQPRVLPNSYPRTLDPTVERHVTEYNQTYGLKPGDREYLDPDLVKAMIRQEAGHDFEALLRDPLQVNAFTGDWDPRKADYGLVKGVAPGADLSVRAGIQWLRRKAYVHDGQGNEVRFRGWPEAVQRYNAHLPDYSDQVMDHLGEIKGGF